jgi:glucose-1-phosphate cytidylyltransferase
MVERGDMPWNAKLTAERNRRNVLMAAS